MPFDRGRHDKHTQKHQDARYKTRAGMARVALWHKSGKRKAVDYYGNPLEAQEMAERHGTKELERWANGRSKTFIIV